MTAWQRLPGADSMALGLDYQYTRYEYSNIGGRNDDLHRLQVPLSAGWSTGTWQLQGMVGPGVSTSSNVMKDLFDEFTGDDLLVTARLEASRSGEGGFRWLGGLAWDRSFGEPRLYPVAGVLFAPHENLEARIAFPDSWIRYRLSGRHEVLARVGPSGHEWHVLSEELDADFDYQAASCSWLMRRALRRRTHYGTADDNSGVTLLNSRSRLYLFLFVVDLDRELNHQEHMPQRSKILEMTECRIGPGYDTLREEVLPCPSPSVIWRLITSFKAEFSKSCRLAGSMRRPVISLN